MSCTLPAGLTAAQVKRLEDFIGYGNLQAKVWFVGMEEAGGGEDNIRKRLKFNRVEDCAVAHLKKLEITRYHSDRPAIQRTWANMARVMLALDGQSEPDTEDVRAYQAGHLGRSRGSSLLLELMPIPKPAATMDGWPYSALLPMYGVDGLDYHPVVRPKRVLMLRNLIAKHRPSLVVCYGKQFWGEFEMLFSGWSEIEEPPIAEEVRNLFRTFKREGQVAVLTHHLTARTMNKRASTIATLASTILAST